jgi:hypothetical protein
MFGDVYYLTENKLFYSPLHPCSLHQKLCDLLNVGFDGDSVNDKNIVKIVIVGFNNPKPIISHWYHND